MQLSQGAGAAMALHVPQMVLPSPCKSRASTGADGTKRNPRNGSTSAVDPGAQAVLGLQQSLCVPAVPTARKHLSDCCSPPSSPDWFYPKGCCFTEC